MHFAAFVFVSMREVFTAVSTMDSCWVKQVIALFACWGMFVARRLFVGMQIILYLQTSSAAAQVVPVEFSGVARAGCDVCCVGGGQVCTIIMCPLHACHWPWYTMHGHVCLPTLRNK